MEGGTVLRGISRAFGGAATAVGRVGQSLSSTIQQALPISSAKATVPSAPLSSSSSSFSSEQRLRSIEDWEFACDDGGIQSQNRYAHPYHVDRQPHLQPRVIFGTVPTREDVIEATSDLQDALNLAINPASSTLDHGTVSSSSILPVNDKLESVEFSRIHEIDGESTEDLVNHVEQEIDQNKDTVLQKSGHLNVIKAFTLLQENPAVQGMVTSLASDQAVWNAVMNNEEVMRFRQSLQKGEPEDSPTDEDGDNGSHGQKNRFFEAMQNMKAKVFEYMEKITEICSQFFGFSADKVFSEKDGEFVRALKVSSMLCVALLLIIVVKRV